MTRYNPVSRKGDRYERESVGIGRVIVPTDMDREQYIQNSYRTGTITIVSKTNLSVMHEVLVDTSVLSEINFPTDNDRGEPTLGSTVVWVNLPVYNQPIVIAKINSSDEQGLQLQENEFSLTRSSSEGEVSIFGSTKGSVIDIVAQSATTGGRMRVSVSNYNNTGLLDITVNGNYFITTREASIRAKKIITSSVNSGEVGTKDTSLTIQGDCITGTVEESSSGFIVEKSTFSIGKGEQSATRGEDLEAFLHKLIDVVASQQVATALGPQPLMNAAGILQLKSETSQWLSKYLRVE